MYLYPDLHLHSNISDGSEEPLELLERVRNSSVDIFSLTDHDAYQGCQTVKEHLVPGDPRFLSGIEFSCVDELGKYHILGYGFDTGKDSIQAAVEITHNARRQKAINRLHYLEEECRFTFTEEEVEALLQNENPGRPHFVALLLKKGYVATKAEGFDLLGQYRGKERRLTPAEAIDAILHADGIPVLAHGILADGSKLLSAEETEKRVKRLKESGLMGLECYYSTYTPEQTEIMLSLAERYNLMVTAGSDYHGKNKSVLFGQNGNPDPKKMERFYRTLEWLGID